MALDPNKKFLYFNKDATLTEMDLALCFPVSSFIGLETQTSSIIHFYFEGSKGADATIVQVVHTQHAYIKNFATSLVDEINFGDKAFIKVYDHAERDTHPSDVIISMETGTPPTFTLEDDEFIVAGDLRINGSLNFDGILGVNNINLGSSFSDNDITLMSAAAINNRFAQINADTTGNAATATLAADATKLATPRAINGVDFDGSAPITVTAAGSTLSDTVTVAKGGTGATTFTSGQILRGNGTSAITADNNLKFDGSDFTIISSTSARPKLLISNTNSDAEAPALVFDRTSTAGADGDDLGVIKFDAEDAVGNGPHTYAQVLGEIQEADDGSEEGKLTLSVASHDAELQPGLILASGNAEDEVDVTVGNTATSVTTVAGTLTMGSTAALTNAGLVAVANQSNITGVGTISSGVWEGTDVGVAHGGTGLSTVGTNEILTGNGASALTSESNLTFSGSRLIIGADDEITPQLRLRNDENTVNIAIADVADNIAPGTVDGDFVIDCNGDHNVIITQNNAAALTIDTNGDSNFNRRFTVTGNTDGTYEGDVVYFGGTTSMTVGTIYHYKSDGTWEAADADAVATSDGLLGVALGAASDTNGMLLRGMVTLDHDPGAVGDVLFLSTTAGDATATAPSGNNDIVRVIGYCLNASNGQIWFNPDSTFVEVTA